MRPADTSPEAWKQYWETVRRMTPSERLEFSFRLTAELFERTEAVLRDRYPNAGQREITLRRARINFGQELFVRAYGDVLDYDGRDDSLMQEMRQQVDRDLPALLLRERSARVPQASDENC